MNVSSVIGAYQSAKALGTYGKKVEALASGSSLTTSKGQAADMAISNELSGELAGIRQGIRNVRDGISMFQVAEGSLGTVTNNLIRMHELAVQAQSGTYSKEQIAMMQEEFQTLSSANTQIGISTKFNGIPMHNDSQTLSISADGQTTISLPMKDVPAVVGDLTEDAEAAAATVNEAVKMVMEYRGELGSHINRLGEQTEVLAEQAEEVLKADTRISNTDMAQAAATASVEEIKAGIYAQKAHSESVQQIANLFFG